MRDLVIRDANGRVINIGPWDYRTQDIFETEYEDQIVDKYDLIPVFDEAGNRVAVYRTVIGNEVKKVAVGYKKVGENILNPLPPGATSAEEDIVLLPDGGRAAANP